MIVPTESDLIEAADQLSKSDKGRQAMTDLLAFFDNSGVSLDAENQAAVLTIIAGVWGQYTGTARDIMRDRLGVS